MALASTLLLFPAWWRKPEATHRLGHLLPPQARPPFLNWPGDRGQWHHLGGVLGTAPSP